MKISWLFNRRPRLERWAICGAVCWLLLIPWLRSYGPPQPIWSARLTSGERIQWISDNGQVLVTFKSDGLCQHFRFWSVATGQSLGGSLDVKSARQIPLGALSASGQYFAAFEETLQAGEKTLVVRDAFTAQERLRMPLSPHMDPGPGLKRVDDSIDLWSPVQLCFAPDESRIAFTGTYNWGSIFTTHVVDLESQSVIFQQFSPSSHGQTSSFSNDSRLLLHVGTRPALKARATLPRWELVDLAGGRVRTVLTPCCEYAVAASFIDQDRMIVSCTHGVSRVSVGRGQIPPESDAVQLWDVVTGEEMARFMDEELLLVGRDRKTFVTKLKQSMRVRAAANGNLLAELGISDTNSGETIFPTVKKEVPYLKVISQTFFFDPDRKVTAEERRRRSWWSYVWFLPLQAAVVDPVNDRVLRAVPGESRSLIPADARIFITQIDGNWNVMGNWRKWWPVHSTMSAYVVESAMPWTTAIWIGALIALPVATLGSWLARRWWPVPVTEQAQVAGTSVTVAQCACIHCGKQTPLRMAKCYHCGSYLNLEMPQ